MQYGKTPAIWRIDRLYHLEKVGKRQNNCFILVISVNIVQTKPNKGGREA